VTGSWQIFGPKRSLLPKQEALGVSGEKKGPDQQESEVGRWRTHSFEALRGKRTNALARRQGEKSQRKSRPPAREGEPDAAHEEKEGMERPRANQTALPSRHCRENGQYLFEIGAGGEEIRPLGTRRASGTERGGGERTSLNKDLTSRRQSPKKKIFTPLRATNREGASLKPSI